MSKAYNVRGFVGQAKLISTLPGYEADRPESEDLSQIDTIRLIQRQLSDQGLETLPQMFELLSLHSLGYDINDPDVVSKAVFLGELHQKQRTKRDEVQAARPVPEPNVYYMRIQNLIKIGFTARPVKQRKIELMADEVLAIEPGGRELERLRHKQFVTLRYRGERFYPGVDLMRHINMIREHFRDHQEA